MDDPVIETSSGMPSSLPDWTACRAKMPETAAGADGIGPGHALVAFHRPTTSTVETGSRKRCCIKRGLVENL